jgi:hypothetical protein
LTTIVVLSAEESEIATSGFISEPRYRPFPASSRARELEEERQRELPEWSRESEEPVIREDEEINNSPAVQTDQRLPRLGAAQHWRQTAREPAFLAARRNDSFQIIAVGTVEGGSRANIQGVRRLEIHVRYVLRQIIYLDVVRAGLDVNQKSIFDGRLAGELRPLPPKLGSQVLAILAERAPYLPSVFRLIREQVTNETIASLQSRRPRPALLRDEAAASALHFFTAGWHLLEPVPTPAPSGFAHELEQLSGAIENDFITDDAAVFPDWERAAYSQGGWWEFRNKGRRLLVKNINVSPQETRTGADLVYVRRAPDTFVLVQYKLLEKLSDGRLVFRPDGRLDGQIARMLALENTRQDSAITESAETYRLGDGFSFVKFVFPEAARPVRPGGLTPGFYLPGEYARRALLTPEMGPQGGSVHFITNHRYLSSDTFARLVRDSWVGSTGDATSLLRQAFNLRDSDADLVLAVDEPLEDADVA